jgi:hypothetical protein
MTQWQPIETAPKDGTEFLVSNGSSIGFASYWGDGKIHSHFASTKQSFFGDGSCVLLRDPTHWMPLPQPPKEQDK